MDENLKKRIEKLENFIESLQASHKIPLSVDQAFRARFVAKEVSVSTHTGETQAVDEGGVATFSVMTTADAFLEVSINGTIYYIPVFT